MGGRGAAAADRLRGGGAPPTARRPAALVARAPDWTRLSKNQLQVFDCFSRSWSCAGPSFHGPAPPSSPGRLAGPNRRPPTHPVRHVRRRGSSGSAWERRGVSNGGQPSARPSCDACVCPRSEWRIGVPRLSARSRATVHALGCVPIQASPALFGPLCICPSAHIARGCGCCVKVLCIYEYMYMCMYVCMYVCMFAPTAPARSPAAEA